MADTNKRKAGVDDRDKPGNKRSKGGNNQKWQTPHQKAKSTAAVATPRGGRIDPGDAGIWATCMKGKEGKATGELMALLEQSAEKFYGIKPAGDADADTDDDAEPLSIEESIAAELSAIQPRSALPKLFQPVFLEVQCVLFFKTGQAVDPAELCRRIAEEAAGEPGRRTHRFLNRLTPMGRFGKATVAGLRECAREVLGRNGFALVAGEAGVAAEEGQEGDEGENAQEADDEETEEKKGEAAPAPAVETPSFTYGIRPSIRNHSALKRKEIIDTVAGLIDKRHKVDLSHPDKTILVEFYQNICGVSVVDTKDWERLKRYNLDQIYAQSGQSASLVDPRNAARAARAEAKEGGKTEGNETDPK